MSRDTLSSWALSQEQSTLHCLFPCKSISRGDLVFKHLNHILKNSEASSLYFIFGFSKQGGFCVSVIFLCMARAGGGQGVVSECCRDCKVSLKSLLASSLPPEAFLECGPKDRLVTNAFGARAG